MPAHRGPWEHGTRPMYQRGCRCDDCRAANRESIRALKDRPAPNHGRSGYENYGCRCNVCRSAMSAHRKALIARKRVWAAVERAVKRGILLRPELCESCGRHGDIEAHHEDYAKPLDVQWLCTGCHGARHARTQAVAA